MSLYSSERPEFLERVASLAGQSTFRTPAGGRCTKSEQLPDAHAIATALAFSRRGSQDIGPDVAYCWVLKDDAYRAKVTRLVCDALCRRADVTRDQVALAVGWAWEIMIHDRTPKGHHPPNVDRRAWDALVRLVEGMLHNSAWDSLADAEKAYKGAA